MAKRFNVSFDGVMDRLEELERENHRLRAKNAELDASVANAARIIAQMWDDVTAMRPIVEAVAASRQPSARRTQARRCLERHVSAHPAPESEA